jgi:hypothetical protein
MTRRWLLVQALVLSACATQHTIGSTCENGMCETAVVDQGIPCVFSTAEPMMTGSLASDPACLTERIHKNQFDMTPCRLFFSLAQPTRSCQSLGFATAEDGMASSTVCEVPQLEAAVRAQTLSSATGWYIEGPPLPDNDDCNAALRQRFRLNGPLPVPGTTWLSCGTAIAAPEDVSPALRMGDEVLSVEPDSCARLPPLPKRTPDDIGALCEARAMPPAGFFTDRSYLDVRSEQCTSGVCLVDATQSPSPWPCAPGTMCGGEPSLLDYTYCSCRCDAAGDGSRAPCTCPPDFTCAKLLDSDVVPDGVAGSYCVREFFL